MLTTGKRKYEDIIAERGICITMIGMNGKVLADGRVLCGTNSKSFTTSQNGLTIYKKLDEKASVKTVRFRYI
jgi:hypothetical protein